MRISGSWHAGLRIRQNGPDVQFKPLYEAIGEPTNRHRKLASLGRMVERLMLLDAVLADTHYSWLGTEHDKVAYFMNGQLNSDFPKQDLPHIAFGEGDQKTVRYFPDKLPFGRGSNARLVPRRAASGHP